MRIKEMKKIIDEIIKSYELFTDANDHARLGDMYKEIECIRNQAEELIKKCDKFVDNLNLHR